MKTKLLSALCGLFALASCTTVEQAPAPARTSGVTTQQTTTSSPYSNSVETRTTRTSY